MEATLNGNLNLILSYKSDIKSAIEAKGVDMTNVPLSGYASAIGQISGGGGGGVIRSLTVTSNGTYTAEGGVDGYSPITVDVPQSVTGYTEKDITEGVQIANLSNSAISVGAYAFYKNTDLETVNLPNCIEVSTEAFKECTHLTTVNLPVCTSIGQSAFYNCSALTTINMPSVEYIGSTAFSSCSALTSIYLPVCINISQTAFASCSSLTSVDLPVCEYIGNNAFANCKSLNSLTLCTDVYWTISYYSRMLFNTPIMSGIGSIYVRSDTYNAWITSTGWSSLSDRFVSVETSDTLLSFSEGTVYGTTNVLKSGFTDYIGVSNNDILSVDLSMCRNISDYALKGCTSLSQVSLPVCEYVAKETFNGCTALTSIDLPVCTRIGDNTFANCTSLSYVNLPVCNKLGTNVFFLADVSFSLILGYSGVVTTGANPIGNLTKVYVPASLVDLYKSAKNWSEFSSQIFPISE